MCNPSPMGNTHFNRRFLLLDLEEERTSDRSAVHTETELAEFYAGRPQLMTRVTENLMLVEDMSVIQKAPYRIYTESTDLPLDEGKGLAVEDTTTYLRYRILTFDVRENGTAMTVTELSA